MIKVVCISIYENGYRYNSNPSYFLFSLHPFILFVTLQLNTINPIGYDRKETGIYQTRYYSAIGR